VLSDEGGVFSMMAGKYTNGAGGIADIYLKGWNGSPMVVDRKGRDTEHLPRPLLTFGLTVQPFTLEELGQQREFWERGLLGRFLYALPKSTVGYRKKHPRPIPAEAADRYRERLHTLLSSALFEDENSGLSGKEREPVVLGLEADARAAVLDFMDATETRLRPHSDLFAYVEWANKLTGHVARIAGLLHLGGHIDDGMHGDVDLVTVNHAIEIGTYLIEHADRLFALLHPDAVVDTARDLLAVIHGRDMKVFTKQDLFSALSRGRFKQVTQLDAPLKLLEAHGFLRQLDHEQRSGPGRPPSPKYAVNPWVWDQKALDPPAQSAEPQNTPSDQS
jgi:hypothetical protein